MSENVFSSYLSVAVAEEHNTEQFMEQKYLENKDGINPIMSDMNGNYGLRHDISDTDYSTDIYLKDLKPLKKKLRKFAKKNNIKLDEDTWAVQAAWWYNGVDCPLTFK